MAPLNDKDRENLVAYLDGELDPASARALEARLNLDPQARAEAVALRKTWELLDYLPRREPSASFTHRTLERVSAQVIKTGAARRRRWRWAAVAGWAAAVLLAATTGYLGVRALLPTREAPPGKTAGDGDRPADPLAEMPADQVEYHLVHNLRLLENKRLYDNVDDLEFLRALDDPDLFGEDATN
jgi:hypothetical protein